VPAGQRRGVEISGETDSSGGLDNCVEDIIWCCVVTGWTPLLGQLYIVRI
jgi:hypothetical protein